MELSKKCLSISPSITLAITAKAKSMAAEGIDVIGFGAGEPDFNTPKFIRDAAVKALDLGLTKYTPASGTLDLKKAICYRLKKDCNLEYEPNQIVVSNGAKHSLFNTFQTILNPGDEVIVLSPYWVTYPELIKMAEGVPVFVETFEDTEFKATADMIASQITSKTKAIVLNNPCNPTGSVYSEDELKDISKVIIENDILVVSDEIYDMLAYTEDKPVSIATFDGMKDRTIVINGASKAYAMTGWRIGYSACLPEIAKVMGSLQSHATSGPNSMAQYATVTALTGPQDEVYKMKQAFNTRRKLIVSLINAVDGISCLMPQGAFYVMMNISKLIGKTLDGKIIKGSLDFADLLLSSEAVAVVPGIAFGMNTHVRLSYATSDEMISSGIKRIESFVKKLK